VPARPDALEMQEAPHLLDYWRVLRKRRWTVLSVFFLIFTLVLIGTLKQKPVYRAKALLEIEKENPHLLSVQELFELDTVSDSYLETQYRVLRSDTLAQRVIQPLALYDLSEFNPKAAEDSGSRQWASRDNVIPTVSAAQNDPAVIQVVLARFRDNLSVEPIKLSRLVEISFESYDPVLAARIVNTLAAEHIEQNLEVRWEATQKASEWLSQQLQEIKGRLEKSENDLQTYAQRNGLLFLESDKNSPENIVSERLRQLQEELTRAQAARYEKEALHRLVEAGDYASLPGATDNKLVQDLTIRLADLQREMALLATNFTPQYPRIKQLQNQIGEIESILSRERTRVAQRISNEYFAAAKREALVRQAFQQQEQQANVVAGRAVQYNILRREVETNQQLYQGLLQRLKEAGVSAGLKASNIRVVDPAEQPRKPARPNLLLNLAMAAVLGLGLGVGAAFFQDYLDSSLKSPEDVERFLGLPALALIPAVESLNGRQHRLPGHASPWSSLTSASASADAKPLLATPAWYRIDANSKQSSSLAEAFRSLRTSVLLSSANRPPRTLLVSSSQPGEGKTTISVNLAISLAQLGQRVLLIDGDMRRPCVRKALDLPNGLGVVSYLTGQQDWRAAVCPAGVPYLDALVCGPLPPNPAELLSCDRMRTLLHEACQEYQFVLLDSPPLLNVADSRILASLVDGVVLVVRGGTTPRELAQRAYAYARDVGAHLIGVVLNNLDLRRGDDYYYRYYHYDYYGSEARTGTEPPN